jgi:hypothetical protein
MPESSGLRPFPIRVIRWLGHDVLNQHPAIQMLHEARAAETARQKDIPLEERPSYKLRQARIFARGRNGYTNPADNEIAMSPQEKAAAITAAAAAEAAKAAAQAAADANAPLAAAPVEEPPGE